VQDTGGSVKRKGLDLLFPTHQEALNWGGKFVEVKILENAKEKQ